MNGPGFVFWGVFVAFAVIVAGYVAWMLAAERREDAASPAEREEER